MTKWQYRIALVTLYTGFALFMASILLLLASVTVIPMYLNYRDHGSIFVIPKDQPHAQR